MVIGASVIGCAVVLGPLCLGCQSISRVEEERANAVLHEVGCPVSLSTYLASVEAYLG
jgi:hypothetical protein